MNQVETTKLTILVGLYEIEIVEWFRRGRKYRGKDKTGTIYQFRRDQIIDGLEVIE